MRIVLDREAFEAALVKMPSAARVVMLVMTADVRDAEPAHKASQCLRLPGPQDQMPVIRHQAPREQFDGIPLQILGEDLAKGEVVGVLVEDPHPAIAAVEDVIVAARFDATKWTRH
jgi:hypothetical protein